MSLSEFLMSPWMNDSSCRYRGDGWLGVEVVDVDDVVDETVVLDESPPILFPFELRRTAPVPRPNYRYPVVKRHSSHFLHFLLSTNRNWC